MLRNVFKRSQTHLSKRLTSILSGQRDRFGGVTVYSSDYPGVSDFKKVLRPVHTHFLMSVFFNGIISATGFSRLGPDMDKRFLHRNCNEGLELFQ